MTYLIIENKKNKQRKAFTTRAQAIDFIKSENSKVPIHVINSWRVERIITEYVDNWYVVVKG